MGSPAFTQVLVLRFYRVVVFQRPVLFLSSVSAKPAEDVESKVCWKTCMDNNSTQSVKMLGCRRRSTFPQSEKFRCDAEASELDRMGPPCTTVHEDIFYMDVVFTHTGLEEGQLVQTAGATASKGWMSYIPKELPWATLPPKACEYLTKTDKYVGCNGEPGTSLLHLPILVENFYPTNTYNVNYYLANKGKQIVCVSFLLRICDWDTC